MLKQFLTLILTLGFLGLVAGCSDSGSTSGDTSKISDEFGGIEPTDEAVAFGSEAIASEFSDDEEYDDPILADTLIDSCIADTNAEIYALRIVWGQLNYDSTSTDATTWDGSLESSFGFEILRKVIRFEPSQDWIVLDSLPNIISWVSQTTVHHDGIFVNIVVPPIEELMIIAPIMVTFTTAPLTVTFPLEAIPSLDTIIYVEGGNAVAFQGYKVRRWECPKGFLAGRWGRDDEGNGVFYGKWMTQHNRITGHLQGTWGIGNDSLPENAFYGKYIDMDGNFMGLIKGRYHEGNSHSDRHRHAGWLKGYYYDADGNVLGVIRGNYHERPQGSGMGFFQGRWRQYCAYEPIAGAIDDGLED